MNQETTQKNKRSAKKESRLTDGILPFIEKPSNFRFNEKVEHRIEVEFEASELFSFFTADIIKEEVTFTR
ncbi:MAG: hypothetical protein ABI148_07415 [Ginsengibacter sp.]